MEDIMANNQSTFEKDYAYIRNAFLYSLLPSPFKWILKFLLLTLIVAAFRLEFGAECVSTLTVYPRDLAGCNGVTFPICHHSNWQWLYNLTWQIWHLFVWIIGYAYFGICF